MIRSKLALLVLSLACGAAACGLLGPRVGWEARLTGGVTAPPLAAGRQIFLLTSQQLYALAAPDGRVLWRHTVPGGGRYAPALAAGRLYLVSDLGTAHAFDAAGGQPLWQRHLGAAPAAPPALYGELMLALSHTHLFALDRDSGRVRWQRAVRAPAQDSLRVIGDQVCLAGQAGTWQAYQAASGAPLYTFRTRGPVAAPPLVTPAFTLLATARGWLHALSLLTGRPIWSYNLFKPVIIQPVAGGSQVLVAAGPRVHAILAGGSPQWSFGCDGDILPPLLLLEQILYVYTDRGNLYALDPRAGQPYWVSKGVGTARSRLHAMGRWPVLTTDVPRRVVAVDPASGGTAWSFAPLGEVAAPPAAADSGVIVATLDGRVVTLQP